LKHEPSNAEILTFAKRISEIKNERVLDSRLKKIFELTQIDSILNSLDLIEKSDMVYFSKLNDIWDFGGIPSRSSGIRIQLSYHPNFNYNKTHSEQFVPGTLDTTVKYKMFRNSLGVSVDWSKPIRQKLQSNFYYSMDYFMSNEDNFNTQLFSNGIYSIIGYSFGIYPNSRTSLYFGINLSGTKSWVTEKIEDTEDVSYEEYFYSGNPYLSLDYYFSPKLRLNCTYITSAFLSNNQKNGGTEFFQISSSINARLLYSIF